MGIHTLLKSVQQKLNFAFFFTRWVLIHHCIIFKKLIFRYNVCLVGFYILIVNINSMKLFDQSDLLMWNLFTSCVRECMHSCMHDMCEIYTHESIL